MGVPGGGVRVSKRPPRWLRDFLCFSLGFAEVFIGLQAYAVAVVCGLRRVRERISIGSSMLDIYNSYT